ncbi:MAG TPA: prephenate dehydratase domain-containing protein [Pyrinomonadaceae bacterium]|nr:prephenate dehydratase domain-containing protein [Pyrinomonadaceae bacterium]
MNSVAIQGIKGSYSEQAAVTLLGESAAIVECDSFGAAIEYAAANGNFAVIPVRNAIVGEIAESAALLKRSSLRVVDELEIVVDHVLAGVRGAVFEGLTTVRSHPEALKQCREFLRANSHLHAVDGGDTASSVRDVTRAKTAAAAAICSRRAADLYGAKVLRERISDHDDNRTTFYLIGR